MNGQRWERDKSTILICFVIAVYILIDTKLFKGLNLKSVEVIIELLIWKVHDSLSEGRA